MKKLLPTVLVTVYCLLFTVLFPSPVRAQSFGVNIHSLARESEENIKCILEWLASNCQTSIVRIWGYQNTFGINGLANLEKVLNAAPGNIRFIVALEDFPYGPPETNPSTWYAQAQQPSSNYYQYVEAMLNKYGSHSKILVWDLTNLIVKAIMVFVLLTSKILFRQFLI
jgi:hypothetical protein